MLDPKATPMTPAELTALEAELRYTAAARAMRHSATTPTGYVEYRAADAIADLRRKLDEAREVIRPLANFQALERHSDAVQAKVPLGFLRDARRWMEGR